MLSKQFTGMNVMSKGSFGDFMSPRCYFPFQEWELFSFLIILIAVCRGKINMVSLPGKFVTIPVAFNFLSLAITVDIGLFRWVDVVFLNIPWLMKLNTLFPHLICAFSYRSHVHVCTRDDGLCVTSYLYPSETGSHGLLLEISQKCPKHSNLSFSFSIVLFIHLYQGRQ